MDRQVKNRALRTRLRSLAGSLTWSPLEGVLFAAAYQIMNFSARGSVVHGSRFTVEDEDQNMNCESLNQVGNLLTLNRERCYFQCPPEG